MLRSECILTPALPEHGKRISVMSRHTLSDGLTKDERITPSQFHLHLPQLAPLPKLVGAYYRGEIAWEGFESRFTEHLKTEAMQILLMTLARQAMTEDITLLCIEATPYRCHRRLLVEEAKVLLPDLKTQIN